MSDILGTECLTVYLLHPFDLIITKLERAGEQDLEDGLLLRERYVDDIEAMCDRTYEAARHLPLSDRVCSQIEYAFEAIFEEKVDLSHLI